MGDSRTYEEIREEAARAKREKSQKDRDIAPLPSVVNVTRRAECENSLERFAKIYFADVFFLPWSADHLRVIELLENCVVGGGQLAIAMPRGSGKTALVTVSAIWATLCGYHDFVTLIGATEHSASRLLSSISSSIRHNPLLLEDFPELCYPVAKLEGIKQRRLLFNGAPVEMEFTKQRIVYPNIPGSRCASAVIRGVGLTGEIRGDKYSRPDGREVRPSLVIVDDPQTDESARHPGQVADREALLNAAILGLAGPTQAISAVMPCTVICHDDLADRSLDRSRNPQWHGIKTKSLYAFPEATEHWEEYFRLRREGQRIDDGNEACNEYYVQHYEIMNAGAIVAWPERFNKNEYSTLQNLQNIRCDRGESAFASEYQNEPIRPKITRDEIDAYQIASKVNGLARGQIPEGTAYITAYIDVMGAALYWVATAWFQDFTGHVIDYGAWPGQAQSYFTLEQIRPTLRDLYQGKSLEECLYSGLTDLSTELLERDWRTPDGGVIRTSRLLVDAQWGTSTDTVYLFARQSKHAGSILPSHGVGITASRIPMTQWKRQPHEIHGDNWVIGRGSQRTVRKVTYDTNAWKTFTRNRLELGFGASSCLSLWGSSPDSHRMIADHLTAEFRIQTSGRGRTVDEWRAMPGRDNHWLDCLVGCTVAASIQGAKLGTSMVRNVRKPKRQRERVYYSE